MQKWEYTTHESRYTSTLSKYGDEGWELVTATFDSTTKVYVFFFKRPKEEK